MAPCALTIASSSVSRSSRAFIRIVSNWLLQLGMKAPEGVCGAFRCRKSTTRCEATKARRRWQFPKPLNSERSL